MKILHCCLANFYVDNFNYQENALPRMNKANGHEVQIIASTQVYDNGKIVYTHPKEYFNEDGIFVKRLEYSKKLPRKLVRKVRIYKNLYEEIDKFQPDIILCHGVQTVDLLTIAKYVKKHENVIFYADNHAGFNNSAQNIISKIFLHKIIYKIVVQKSLAYINKVLYLSSETKTFLKEMYKIPDEKLAYYPLGGKIFSESERLKYKEKIRNELNIEDLDIVLIHSGKMNPAKKTDLLLSAFHKVKNQKMKLIIIGSISEKYSKIVIPLIESDKRILYLGWKSGVELQEYLCAGDIYIQPGSQSATMQNALCCGNAVILTPVEAHKSLLKDAGIYITDERTLVEALHKIGTDFEYLDQKRKECFKIAQNMLDYSMLAEKLVIGFDEK